MFLPLFADFHLSLPATGALEVVSATKAIYEEQLQGVHCLRSAGQQLDEYRGLICDVMSNKFVSMCVAWEVN